MRLTIRSAEPTALLDALRPDKHIRLLWEKRSLILQLVRREVVGRYRGSLLGTLWTVLLPLAGVLVYTFVFGYIFKTRWPGLATASVSHALVLWAGLAVFSSFSEVLQRACSVIPAHPNLVKRVAFPLEILPVMLVGTSLIPFTISLLMVTFGLRLILHAWPEFSCLLLALLCFVIWLQGIAWLFAGIGTFLRDLAPMVQGLLPLIMFLSPIFYPLEAIPESIRGWFWLNPLTTILELIRSSLLSTAWPPGIACYGLVVLSLTSWLLGACIFSRLRPEMADVV
ncbi:MAG TPA: ABC transporter permease [Gemmatales bacterium]|nr:ABC transporter permease [Gemmatales bacterium]HMP16594.1 ABC transporter permease [Gemmatales bacterium]